MNKYFFATGIFLVFHLGGFAMAHAQIDIMAEARKKPGFSANIPDAICNQEFPFHQRVPRQLYLKDFSEKNSSTLNVFAFTTQKFEAKKDSVLVMNGGPGGMFNATSAKEIAQIFPSYNVVFFFYRGGGCTGFPSPNTEWDSLLTSRATIVDMEGIRAAYGIKQWKAVLGFSYGTNVARQYAHHFPTRVQNLILEGLDNFYGKDVEPAEAGGNSSSEASINMADTVRIIQTLKHRYEKTPGLEKRLPAASFQKFIEMITQYLANVSPRTNYSLLGYWETFQPLYQKAYADLKQKIPAYYNRKTFAAMTSLVYTSNGEDADAAFYTLLQEFAFLEFDKNVQDQLAQWTDQMTYILFPFLNPNYLETFHKTAMISYRVQVAMTANDKSNELNESCTSVKTLVLNGTQDSATPLANVDTYLKNRSCASGNGNQALIVEGGGHSNLSSVKCLGVYANQMFNGKEDPEILKSCTMPVQLKKY